MTVVDQLSFSRNTLNQYVKKIEKLIESEVVMKNLSMLIFEIY